MFEKIVNGASILISVLYGFLILRIFDLLYIPSISFPNDPMFQHPSSKGIVIGALSVFIYFILIFILNYIVKVKLKRNGKDFICKNFFAFFFGFILFFIIGPFVLPYNCTSGP